jgi:hypothetical protein
MEVVVVMGNAGFTGIVELGAMVMVVVLGNAEITGVVELGAMVVVVVLGNADFTRVVVGVVAMGNAAELDSKFNSVKYGEATRLL